MFVLRDKEIDESLLNGAFCSIFERKISDDERREKNSNYAKKFYARGLGSELIAPCILNLQDIISLSTTSGFLLD